MKHQINKVINSDAIIFVNNKSELNINSGNKKPQVRSTTSRLKHTNAKKNEEISGHLAAIVESCEDAIVSKSLKGIIRSWNKGGEKIFGYTAAEAIGKHISFIIPPEYIDEEKKILSRIINDETIDHYETIRLKKNGEGVHVSLTVSPLKDSSGKIIGASKIARDITIRKRTEAELIKVNREFASENIEKEKAAAELRISVRELAVQNNLNRQMAMELSVANEELRIQNVNRVKEVSDYKHALDESSILAFTDQKGVINYVNDNFCKISKYSAEELVGKDHRIIDSAYHTNEFIRDLWDTIAKGKIWHGEIQNRAKDGTLYWVDTTIIPFLDNQGKPYQYASIWADITLRKQAEEEVRTLNEELEKRVKDRTEDLESFSFSVSHDLRAPLRAINGYARMFKAKYGLQFDPEGNRLINNIVDNTTRMGQLIDDLLTFSRLGRREMNCIDLPMHEIVTGLCQELKKDQVDREIEFDVRHLLSAKADNIGIKQVWLNLVSNAIKYSRLKKIALIEIGSEITGDEITYYVKDNGAGFDMRYVSKLFNIFQRLHSDEEFEGTGVGLAIVQRIIQKHGGRVWATGTLNEGATFYFTLKNNHV